ncbi:hypothetical protein FRC11_005568 [Ceratobasidium sp. 423]|nr:hypothetical protein FRC11_005568 [Ceratobasidium sp. 423]
MHLLFKNLVPNMIWHWTGRFKGLGQGTGNYELAPHDWAEIGRLMAQATKTIPSEFVGMLPNIAQDENLYKAEAYAFWVQYLAPILLEGRLLEKYYEHFLLMHEIIILVLQFELTYDNVEQLQAMVNTWVVQYEEYYYQHEANCLPTCPLTIHALLHLPYYIRTSGPLWTSWAFIMEQFCGHILPAVKNRTRPYEHLANYVQCQAQMQVVSLNHCLQNLAKPIVNFTYAHGEKFSSHERIMPVHYNIDVGVQLRNQLAIYFSTVYVDELGLNAVGVRAQIDTDMLVSYGCFHLTGDGDRFHTADLIAHNRDTRDNSFVRYEILPNANASLPDAPDVPVRQVYYGQLLDIFYIEFITNVENDVREPFLLARVRECRTGGLDAALLENPLVVYKRTSNLYIIHLDAITYVVGRVKLAHSTWAIVDRSSSGARTQFVNANGEPEDFN